MTRLSALSTLVLSSVAIAQVPQPAVNFSISPNNPATIAKNKQWFTVISVKDEDTQTNNVKINNSADIGVRTGAIPSSESGRLRLTQTGETYQYTHTKVSVGVPDTYYDVYQYCDTTGYANYNDTGVGTWISVTQVVVVTN